MSRSIHSPDHRKLCELLIAARKEAGLTQAQLASRIKRPQSFVAKYEGGERRVDVIEFIAFAKALGRDPREVFDELVRSSKGDTPSRKQVRRR